MKPGHTGLRRLLFATGYSLSGLIFAWRSESAFRQELVLALVLAPLALLLGSDAVERILLLGTLLLVLIVELLNTALEAVVDRVGPELHPLSGAAKDAGSAAVLLTLLLTGLVWCLIAIERYWPAG